MSLEAKIKGFKFAALFLILSACGVNPVDTSYNSSSLSAGGGSLASTDTSSPIDYTSSGNRVASVSKAAAAPAAAPITMAAAPQSSTGIVYMPAQAFIQSGGAYFPIAGTANTTVNGVPVTINNPAPYSSLSSSDQQVIRKNVFGVAQPQPSYVIVPSAQPSGMIR